MEDPGEQAWELLEKWRNGQKKYVLSELSAMSSMRAACVAAEMCRQLTAYGDVGVADAFINSMKERL